MAKYSSMQDYITKLGGKRVVKRVLIANNGIGAVKAIRSIRRWAYETFGNEREVRRIRWLAREDGLTVVAAMNAERSKYATLAVINRRFVMPTS